MKMLQNYLTKYIPYKKWGKKRFLIILGPNMKEIEILAIFGQNWSILVKKGLKNQFWEFSPDIF